MSDDRSKKKIRVLKDGPFLVSGGVPLDKQIVVLGLDMEPARWEKGPDYPLQETYSLCRCGHSARKPFCDGAHTAAGFDGTETAVRKSHAELAEKTSGPGLDLLDAACFCSIGRFCHRAGDTWTLTENSGDPEARRTAIEEAGDCPSGRLVALEKGTGRPLEPPFPPSVSIIVDTKHSCGGPIWVRGGIPVESSDGYRYEVRNRVTLCRCGRSENKPFCDGTHVKIRFRE